MLRFNSGELAIHYAKHRADFSVTTDVEYELEAERFLLLPPHPDLLEFSRAHGDKVRYHKMTQEFAVLSSAGVIRTYFRPVPCSSLPPLQPKKNCHGMPDNLQYFTAECAR